eukprot:2022085-Rhodomonas_salina.4
MDQVAYLLFPQQKTESQPTGALARVPVAAPCGPSVPRIAPHRQIAELSLANSTNGRRYAPAAPGLLPKLDSPGDIFFLFEGKRNSGIGWGSRKVG